MTDPTFLLPIDFVERQSEDVHAFIGYTGYTEAAAIDGPDETGPFFDLSRYANADYMDSEGNLACMVEDTIRFDLLEPFTMENELGTDTTPGYPELVYPVSHWVATRLQAHHSEDPERSVDFDSLLLGAKNLTILLWLSQRYTHLYNRLLTVYGDEEDVANFVPSALVVIIRALAADLQGDGADLTFFPFVEAGVGYMLLEASNPLQAAIENPEGAIDDYLHTPPPYRREEATLELVGG